MTFADYDLVRFQLQHIDGAQAEVKKIEKKIQKLFPELNELNPRKQFIDQYFKERVIDSDMLKHISLDPIFMASLQQQTNQAIDRDAVIRHLQDPLHTAFYPGHLVRAYTVGIGFEIERARYIQFRMRQEIPHPYTLNDYTESELIAVKQKFTPLDKPLLFRGKPLEIPLNGALAFLQDEEPEIPELYVPRSPIVRIEDNDFAESLLGTIVLDQKEFIPERQVLFEYGFYEPLRLYIGKIRNSIFVWRPAVPSNEFFQAIEYFLGTSWMSGTINEKFLPFVDLRPIMDNYQAFLAKKTDEEVKLLRAAQDIIVKSQKTNSYDLLRLYGAKKRTLLSKFKDLPSKVIKERIRYDEIILLNQLKGLELLLLTFGAMPKVRDGDLYMFWSMVHFNTEKLDRRVLGSFVQSGSNIHIQFVIFLLDKNKDIFFPESRITVKKDPLTAKVSFNDEIVATPLASLETLYELQPWDIYAIAPAEIASAEKTYLYERFRQK